MWKSREHLQLWKLTSGVCFTGFAYEMNRQECVILWILNVQNVRGDEFQKQCGFHSLKLRVIHSLYKIGDHRIKLPCVYGSKPIPPFYSHHVLARVYAYFYGSPSPQIYRKSCLGFTMFKNHQFNYGKTMKIIGLKPIPMGKRLKSQHLRPTRRPQRSAPGHPPAAQPARGSPPSPRPRSTAPRHARCVPGHRRRQGDPKWLSDHHCGPGRRPGNDDWKRDGRGFLKWRYPKMDGLWWKILDLGVPPCSETSI